MLINELTSICEEDPYLLDLLVGYLKDIDIKEEIIPDLIVEKISNQDLRKDLGKVCSLSKFARMYPDNSSSWRKIAHKVCELADNFSYQDKQSIFIILSNYEARVNFATLFSGTNEDLERETDPILIPFREWRCKMEWLENDL